MRRPVVAAVMLALWTCAASRVGAEGGAHIIVVTSQGEDLWLVREFTDNSLIQNALAPVEIGGTALRISLEAPGAASPPVTMLEAQSRSLIVFASENVSPIEERLAVEERAGRASELKLELTRQIVGGLFEIPLWPFLVASEVPVRSIDVERSYRLADLRESFFPAASYAGTGSIPDWRVERMTSDGSIVAQSPGTGEGMGIAFEYLVRGSVDSLEWKVRDGAGVAALYVGDASLWRVAGARTVEVPSTELLASLDKSSTRSDPKAFFSRDLVSGKDGAVARFLFAPEYIGDDERAMWSGSGAEPFPMKPPVSRSPSLPLAIILCWPAFCLFVLLGNWVYPFSNSSFSWLAARAFAVYPFFLLISLLTSGFWGLGFIAAAVASSRFLAPEGSRLRAVGVLFAACFAVTVVSWILVR